MYTQYNDLPLKGDDGDDTRPRMVPVHLCLEEILERWWTEGFELVHGRPPMLDDFIVPTRAGTNHTKSTAYKMCQRALKAVDVPNQTLHATRHTFISVARENGARGEILERVTHSAKGQIVEPIGTLDDYTTFGWTSLCQAVACVDFGVDSETGVPAFPLDAGSRAWTRSKRRWWDLAKPARISANLRVLQRAENPR